MASGSVIRMGAKYAIKYRVSNGNQVIKLIGTKDDAELALKEVVNQIKNGTYKDLEEISFKDFGKVWLSDKESKHQISMSKMYRNIFNRHLNPYFKEKKLNKITLKDINGYINFKTNENKLSGKTISLHVTILKMMFKKAVKMGYLNVDPSQTIRKGMNILSSEEINRFLTLVSPPYYAFFLTAIDTGMSMSELMVLRWRDIDWKNKVIFVKKRIYTLKETSKNASRYSERKIHVPSKLLNELKKERKSKLITEDDLIFTHHIADGRNIYQAEFSDTLKRAGLRRIRFEDLRHTYAVNLVNEGKNIRFIQRQLGYLSLAMMIKTYGYLLPKESEDNRKIS